MSGGKQPRLRARLFFGFAARSLHNHAIVTGPAPAGLIADVETFNNVDLKMNRIKKLSCFAILLILGSNISLASDKNWCGKMIEGNWRVVDPGTIPHHILEKVKVKYDKNNDQFDVDIEDNATPSHKYEGKDFQLSCTARPPAATLTGEVEIDSCTHTLEIAYPYIKEDGTKDWHQVGFEYLYSHPTGSCPQHPLGEHDDEFQHPGTAHGSDN